MILLIEKSIDILSDIVNALGTELPEDIKEKIDEFVIELEESKTFTEAIEKEIESGEDGIIEALRKVVFRDGKRTVIQKKKMKASEKMARSKAAKKAGTKRKGKKMKASSIMKLKKSLKKAKA